MQRVEGPAALSLDAKGRFAIPTRHRDALVSPEGVVLTAHPDGCLLIYTRLAWEPVAARVQQLSSFDRNARTWQRLLTGHAQVVVPDAQGRILVAPELRQFAELKKDAMLVGQGSHFELWDAERWAAVIARGIAEIGSAPPSGAENFSL